MAFILVVVGGYYILKGNKAAPTPVDTDNQEQVVPTTATYATSTYSVTYPTSFTIDPNFENTTVSPTKPIAGVKFTIPLTMATGTNLSADSFVSIEELPRAKSCTGDIYLADNVTAHAVSDNGVTYSVATTSGAGAGNFYEEMVFAISASKPCTAVRYFIHSTNINNYPAGAVREFDRAALIAAFDQIRTSLIFGAPATQSTDTVPAGTETGGNTSTQ